MPDQPRPVQMPRQAPAPAPAAAPEPVLQQDDLDQPTALRQALKLPPDATAEDVLRQASGLVASIFQLRKKIYAGIIDPVLRANGVNL